MVSCSIVNNFFSPLLCVQHCSLLPFFGKSLLPFHDNHQSFLHGNSPKILNMIVLSISLLLLLTTYVSGESCTPEKIAKSKVDLTMLMDSFPLFESAKQN
jgi:hypothetical protein